MEGTHNDYSSFSFFQDGFKIHDEAEDTGDSTIKYYGYLNRLGEWWIMKRTTTAPKTYRYVKGSSAYTTAWTARETLDYDYLNEAYA